MKVLLLAPQPCHSDRGTPIAIDMTIATLASAGYEIDLLTFPGGKDLDHPGLRVQRVGTWTGIDAIKVGFSAKKLWLDFLMLFDAIGMARRERYDLVHAVEESSFIALLLRALFRVPYVADIDSSMTTQLVDRWSALRPLRRLLAAIESIPTRFASSVVAMCDSLGEDAARTRGSSDGVYVVKDVSLLDYYEPIDTEPPVLLRRLQAADAHLSMYVGNLERYQGIDLMLEGFAASRANAMNCHLIIIGGSAASIEHYRQRADVLGLRDNAHFLGPQPVQNLGVLMGYADVMVSPRTSGANTPLKLYSYLDSGKPVLATDLPTHTQVVDNTQALLVAPSVQAMADGFDRLFDDGEIASEIAERARRLVREKHSLQVFRRELLAIYAHISANIGAATELRSAESG
ncbi:MAG: glycosyltransferase family 4 protein [Pseudomonadota bacterium]